MQPTPQSRLLTRNHARRGSALVLSVFILSAVAVLSVSLVSANVAANREQRQQQESMSAMYASEAGIGAAVFDLEHGGTGDLGSEQTPATFGSDSYWVQATDLGDGFVSLESTGTSSRTSTRVELIVRAEESGFFRWGAFGDEGLTMDSNAQVDSYDSGLGSYASQDVNGSGSSSYANANGDVGSNADVSMDSNVKVWGDATPGPDHSATVTGNAKLSGSSAPATNATVLPPLVIPTFPGSGDAYFDNKKGDTIPSGDYQYGSFHLDGNAIVVIEGPATIVCDSWVLDSNAELYVDATNGGVEIYVYDDFLLNSNTLITSLTNTPADIAINLESDNIINPDLDVDLDQVDFESNAQLFGTVYAPNAAIEINSNFELYGSVVARSVHLDSNSRIHYDETLGSSGGGGGDDYEAVCWRVRPMPGNSQGEN